MRKSRLSDPRRTAFARAYMRMRGWTRITAIQMVEIADAWQKSTGKGVKRPNSYYYLMFENTRKFGESDPSGSPPPPCA